MLFEAAKGRAGLQEALARLCKEAEESVTEGVNYIVLTDRNVDATHAIPHCLPYRRCTTISSRWENACRPHWWWKAARYAK